MSAEGQATHTDDLPSLTVMGVEYVHVALGGGDDLYVTPYGLPFLANLRPENYWSDKAYFRAHSERLAGSSTLYRIRTKPLRGRSAEIVLKWNRMGQDVPGATRADDIATAEFNSPFEEFALILELRGARDGEPRRVLTHKPLAIYVPRERVDIDRLGRRPCKLQAKQDLHREIQLDVHRKYAVLYEWVKGIDAVQACRRGAIDRPDLLRLVERVGEEMRGKGFVVRDNKAEHVIVRPDGTGGLVRGGDGQVLYAAIDFELLERTPAHEAKVRAEKRRAYLVRQAHRFEPHGAFPPHLHPVRVLGVDYVYGHIESTDGALWVVGRDPDLFEYFLPEKWRKTPRTRLSVTNQVYETTTKDNVRLVWRVSKVGEQPDMDPFKADEKRILQYGCNSPFEEVSLALELSAGGIDTIYPRAIYMTGEAAQLSAALADERRCRTHAHLLRPDGLPVLQPGHDYILLWGYWNAPDDFLAERDDPLYTSINALNAYREGLVDEETYLRLMQVTRQRLEAVGVEDLNLRGTHLLLSLNKRGELVTDAGGLPATRICNFELLRRVKPAGEGPS